MLRECVGVSVRERTSMCEGECRVDIHDVSTYVKSTNVFSRMSNLQICSPTHVCVNVCLLYKCVLEYVYLTSMYAQIFLLYKYVLPNAYLFPPFAHYTVNIRDI